MNELNSLTTNMASTVTIAPTATTSGTILNTTNISIDPSLLSLLEDDVPRFAFGTRPTVSKEVKTQFEIIDSSICVNHYKDGKYVKRRKIISDFKDITRVQNTIIMTFADNTKTKATLDAEDEFNLERAISVCITKKLLGEEGSSIYNKLIGRALKVMKRNEKAAEQAKKDEAEIKRIKKAAEERRKKKKAKRREEAIKIQEEAYIRAMRAIKAEAKE